MLHKLHALAQRLCWGTLDLLLALWELVSLSPLRYCTRRRTYRTSVVLSCCALVKWLALLSVAPVLFILSSALYGATNVAHTQLFTRIAQLTLIGDLLISLTLLGWHLYLPHRDKLLQLLNGLNRLRHIQLHWRWTHALLLWFKLLLSVYELLCNIPFLHRIARRLPWPHMLAYAMQLHVQHLSSIYENGVLAMLLLLLASLEQLERQWQQCAGGLREIYELLRLERRLLKLCNGFAACFQLGIFLLLIGHFLNILANLYAMLDYFVSQHGVPLTISNYVLIVTAELYTLVLAAHLCQSSHRRVRQCSLDVCYRQAQMPIRMTPFGVLPLETLELPILGLFQLNNGFWLFLVSYAVNFIVIILQFTVENMKR